MAFVNYFTDLFTAGPEEDIGAMSQTPCGWGVEGDECRITAGVHQRGSWS